MAWGPREEAGPKMNTKMRAKVFGVALSVALLSLLPTRARALPWSGASGEGLHAAIKGFKTFDVCLGRLAKKLPGEVVALLSAESLEMLCRAQQAVAEDNPTICRRGIKNYQVRKDCQRFYAAYTGRTSDCPTRGHPAYAEGHCLAVASRNPGLCTLVKPDDRPTCLGVILGSKHCGQLKGTPKALCQAAARAWKGLIKAQPAQPPLTFKPRLKVQATALSSGITIPSGGASFDSSQLDQGILVADRHGKGDWFVINYSFAPTEYYVRHRKRGPVRIELQVPLGANAIGTHRVTGGAGGGGKVSFSSRAPTYRYVNMQTSSGSVTFSRFDRKLGGRLTGTFWMVATDGVDKVRVEGSFDTFVRQLVPLSKVESYMRYRVKPRKRHYYNRGRLSQDELNRVRARIRRVKDNLYDVDPSLRNELVADTAMIRYGASVSSNRHKQGGYKLYTVHRNGVLWWLGLRDRDTISAINKKSLDKPEDVYAAYGRLKKARKIVVEVLRGTKTIKLTYRIRRVRQAAKKRAKKKPTK